MAHLAEYESIPDAHWLDNDDLPIGALILAHQAVSWGFLFRFCPLN